MKNLLLPLLAITLFGCSKSGPSTPSTPTITLNTKEKQLLGHWQLKKVVDSSGMKTGSTFTPTINTKTEYQTTDFIEPQEKRDFTKNYEVKFKDARIGGAGAALGGINSPSTGIINDFNIWYYDESISKFMLENVAYDVISVSATELVLWRSTISGSYYTSTTSIYTK